MIKLFFFPLTYCSDREDVALRTQVGVFHIWEKAQACACNQQDNIILDMDSHLPEPLLCHSDPMSKTHSRFVFSPMQKLNQKKSENLYPNYQKIYYPTNQKNQ